MKRIVELYIYKSGGPVVKEGALCIAGTGISGDRYADGGPRQIQIISASAQQALLQGRGECFHRFHANVVLNRLSAGEFEAGQKLQLDEAEVEITGFKSCPFSNCAMRRERHLCILQRETAMARVTRTGRVRVGGIVK